MKMIGMEASHFNCQDSQALNNFMSRALRGRRWKAMTSSTVFYARLLWKPHAAAPSPPIGIHVFTAHSCNIR
jgi:hypothetical protein